MKKQLLLALFLPILALSSCSKFTKLQKENDIAAKLKGADDYYNEGECLKSGILYEELIPHVKGTAQYEEVLYHHAKSSYCDEDYILSNYYFNNFVKTFPSSDYSEECAYLGALCLFKESPHYSLDQEDTRKAIDELQLFIDKYPTTDRKDTINYMVKGLRAKLELKAFEGAKQYHHIRRYKSAVIALDNALKEYPDSRYREQMMFLIVESNYELAINSIESKKEERLLATIESYHNFVDAYGESSELKKAQVWYDNAIKELEDLRANK